ncbi:MAG: MFS transporter [Chloroflexi bacterium]|nr:MFS transporter [Chloroflexota bacterium]
MLTRVTEGWQALTPDMRAFALYSLLSNIGIGVFLTLFNLYLTQLGLREDFIGLLSGVQTAALALAAVLLGPVVNRAGTVRVTQVGLAVFSASSLAMCLTAEPVLLLAAGLVNGAAWAALIVPNMPLVIERVPEARRTEVSSLTFGVQMLSVTIGNLLGGVLPGALVLLVAEMLWRDRLTLVLGVGLAALGLLPLRRIGPPPQSGAAMAGGGPVDARARRAVRRDLIVFALTGALLAAGASATQPFMNVYFAELGASTAGVGLIFSASSLLGAALTLAGPALARRIGALESVVWLRLGILPLFVPLLVTGNLALAVLSFVGRVAAFSIAWPIEATLMARLIPERQRAVAFGYRSASWNGSWALFSFIAGQVIVRAGYAPVFAFFIVTSLLSALLFLWHFGPRLRKRA